MTDREAYLRGVEAARQAAYDAPITGMPEAQRQHAVCCVAGHIGRLKDVGPAADLCPALEATRGALAQETNKRLEEEIKQLREALSDGGRDLARKTMSTLIQKCSDEALVELQAERNAFRVLLEVTEWDTKTGSYCAHCGATDRIHHSRCRLGRALKRPECEG